MPYYKAVIRKETHSYSRLRLWWVIPQRNALPLDFVEALLTEMIPVGKKAIFGWTVPSTQHSPSQATEPPITAGQGGGREQRAGHQRRQGHSMMKIYGTQSLFGLVFFGLVFLQSKPSADNDKHEGEIKTHTHTKKWGFAGRKTKNTEARQDNTKQKAKAKHRLALNLSNGITSSKL